MHLQVFRIAALKRTLVKSTGKSLRREAPLLRANFIKSKRRFLRSLLKGILEGILWFLWKNYLPDTFCCFYYFKCLCSMKCPVRRSTHRKAPRVLSCLVFTLNLRYITWSDWSKMFLCQMDVTINWKQ